MPLYRGSGTWSEACTLSVSRKWLFREKAIVLLATELLEKGEKKLPGWGQGEDRQSPQSGDTSFSSCDSLRVSISLKGS